MTLKPDPKLVTARGHAFLYAINRGWLTAPQIEDAMEHGRAVERREEREAVDESRRRAA